MSIWDDWIDYTADYRGEDRKSFIDVIASSPEKKCKACTEKLSIKAGNIELPQPHEKKILTAKEFQDRIRDLGDEPGISRDDWSGWKGE